MFYSFKYRINNDSYSTLYSTFYIIFGLKTRDESKDQMTYLNQFSQRFLNVSKGLITLKLLDRQPKKQVYEDSTQFRDLTMRILKVHFIKFDARIHKYAWYWIGCIRSSIKSCCLS